MFKFLFNKIFFILLIVFTSIAYAADDVADMKSISEAAGNSAEQAAAQLTSDAGKITENLKVAIEALGTATTESGNALDTTLSEALKAMDFATNSLAKGDITAAIQIMSLIESAADLALASVSTAKTLDMSKVDFVKDFSPAEIIAILSIAGQMGVGKVVALQKMAGQMSATSAAGFDSKGMISAMDAKGIGIGKAMTGMAKAGVVDMETISGTTNFSMDNFDPASFASMNVAEMGMSPIMMIGALTVLPVGSATAALESLQSGKGKMAKGFEGMAGVMNGAIAATMGAKGMGSEMMSTMGTSMGISGMPDLASGMEGVLGIIVLGETIGATGISAVADSLTTAFSVQETGITSAMFTTIGVISSAISEKSPKRTTAAEQGSAAGSVAATMTKTGLTPIEMPENISASGMMMGGMVMSKSTLSGGLPGVMAPPKTMTPAAYIEAQEKIDKLN